MHSRWVIKLITTWRRGQKVRGAKGVKQIIGTLQTHIGADRRSARECAGGSRNSQLDLDLLWIDWVHRNSFRLSNPAGLGPISQRWRISLPISLPKLLVRPCGAQGVICSPERVQIVAREERWAVWLPGERIAWFPAPELGNQRLAIERRVLRLLEERCSYQAPRILFVSDSGFDVR